MIKAFVSTIALLSLASAVPFHELSRRAALVGEDLPWQIHNLSISALPSNTTERNATQHIIFTAIDTNENLTMTTTCQRFEQAGTSLFSQTYTKCEFANAGFSLRSDGMLWFHRRIPNGEPFPWNSSTCTGFGDLTKAKYYSNGPGGMQVFDDYIEISCTLMNGR